MPPLPRLLVPPVLPVPPVRPPGRHPGARAGRPRWWGLALLAALVHLGSLAPPLQALPAGVAAEHDGSGRIGSGVDGVEIHRSGPDPEIVEALRGWLQLFRPEARPLLASWSVLATQLARRPEVALRGPCYALGRALGDLDRRRLLPVPEVAADRALRAALGHLDFALRACGERRPFALEGRLAQAAGAYGDFAARLGLYGLEP